MPDPIKEVELYPMPDPPDEPEIIESAPETEPETEASKDDPDLITEPKPEPEEETVADESEEYTQEEWEALPEDERDRITKEYEAATAQVADEAKPAENIKALETELRQKIESYETKAREADKLLTQRLQQLSEAAKLAGPDVKEQFGMLKDIGKSDKSDPNRKAIGFKDQVYYTTLNVPRKQGETAEAHYQRVAVANKYQNDRKNEEMLAQQDYVAEMLEPIRPLIEEAQTKKMQEASGKAWEDTFFESMKELNIPNDANAGKLIWDVIKDLGYDLLGQGTSLSPEARKVIAKSVMTLKLTGAKPRQAGVGQDGKVIQFSGKRPPSGALRTFGNGNPPKRPPNTIAGRGTGSKSSTARKDKIIKDLDFYAAGGDA